MLLASLLLFACHVCIQIIYMFYPLFAVNKKEKLPILPYQKGISIIIPAYNEEKIILNCLEGIVKLNYDKYEVIIVNDGSTDRTLQLLENHLQLKPDIHTAPALKIPHQPIKDIYCSRLLPKVKVIDKKNGGKADALNAGTEYSKYQIVVTLDADSVLDPNSLHAINTTFEDEKIAAAGGMVQIRQGFKGKLPLLQPHFQLKGLVRYQILQYLSDFHLHKLTQSKINTMSVIAGAFGAFRKQVLFDVDGYRKTVGEDMDITLKIHLLLKSNPKYKGKRLKFVPHAICYTECPEAFTDLLQQRIRWQKGFLDCILHYKNKYFRKLGFRISFFFLFESFFLGTINAFPTAILPVIILLSTENYMVALALLSISVFLSFYRSIITLIVIHRYGIHYTTNQLTKFVLFLLLEIFTYKLLGLVFVIAGTFMYFKNKDSWYVSKRIGDKSVPFETTENALPDNQAV
ncbi:glycosyltransferase family 2 protein [Gracilibacillus xinjiangensis]|uniref:Glycosyltransferase n=1 Tax=Gracilibacillus xinjiangensis TaxID=1193282 RepID=A0ABV8WUV3_9BACI